MNIQPLPSVAQWQVLEAMGRIDAHTALEVEKVCHQAIASAPHLALDLRGVMYMSSAGLRILLSSFKLANAAGGEFVLVAPQENVKEVLEISGFSSILRIVNETSELA